MPSNNKYLREEYRGRINRVIDYIEAHLDDDLSLETLAQEAHFSRFHFHRLFHAMMGETLNHFIQRLRLQKAASWLVYYPKKSITEIAIDCGFSGSAAFARAFKNKYAMSASAWREGGYLQDRKMSKTDRKDDQTSGKNGKDAEVIAMYIDPETHTIKWRITMIDTADIQIEVQDVPAQPVAYVRHIGPYQGNSALFGELFGKLMKWAGPRGLLRFPETKMISVYHDDPETTDEQKLRLEVCITVPEDTPVEGEIGKMTIPGGQVAVARFEISDEEYAQAWKIVFGDWLPESGYVPDDRPCYEVYHNDPKTHPEHKHIVDICVPVVPL